MAPQEPVAATVLGTIGTVLWCVQLVPQVYTNWHTKSTEGLPSSMMFLWALCGVPFGTYAIGQQFNIPLQVQPQCFMALCLVSWCQCLLYSQCVLTVVGSKWALWKVWLLGTGTGILFGGVEAALILSLRPIYENGNETPMIVIGIVAAILLAVGLLPPYGEAWKRRGRIIGINWIFLSMDSMGAFFSLMSLVPAAQNNFDILGGVMYIICMLLEIGIFLSHIIWLCRTRKIRNEAKSSDKTFDDVAAEHEREGRPFAFAERKTTWRRKTKEKPQDEENGSDNELPPAAGEAQHAVDAKADKQGKAGTANDGDGDGDGDGEARSPLTSNASTERPGEANELDTSVR
ncbi:Uu.00g025220.m01.CDS01 [Anthostomella pinea]|uniref:Uu.00g025220.m01.CDS01 n=1 Tax=Anthostomella pinea TaxID=933095 RepID=A0AAI8V797_9PEZI|nr:Uu.00g025220.m01.CDS01 [Anthostomella pinea]